MAKLRHIAIATKDPVKTAEFYKKAFDYYQMGYASALACVLFLVIMVVTWIQFRYSKWVYYEGELRK